MVRKCRHSSCTLEDKLQVLKWLDKGESEYKLVDELVLEERQ